MEYHKGRILAIIRWSRTKTKRSRLPSNFLLKPTDVLTCIRVIRKRNLHWQNWQKKLQDWTTTTNYVIRHCSMYACGIRYEGVDDSGVNSGVGVKRKGIRGRRKSLACSWRGHEGKRQGEGSGVPSASKWGWTRVTRSILYFRLYFLIITILNDQK